MSFNLKAPFKRREPVALNTGSDMQRPTLVRACSSFEASRSRRAVGLGKKCSKHQGGRHLAHKKRGLTNVLKGHSEQLVPSPTAQLRALTRSARGPPQPRNSAWQR